MLRSVHAPRAEEWLCWPCKVYEEQQRNGGMPQSEVRPKRWEMEAQVGNGRGGKPHEGGGGHMNGGGGSAVEPGVGITCLRCAGFRSCAGRESWNATTPPPSDACCVTPRAHKAAFYRLFVVGPPVCRASRTHSCLAAPWLWAAACAPYATELSSARARRASGATW